MRMTSRRVHSWLLSWVHNVCIQSDVDFKIHQCNACNAVTVHYTQQSLFLIRKGDPSDFGCKLLVMASENDVTRGEMVTRGDLHLSLLSLLSTCKWRHKRVSRVGDVRRTAYDVSSVQGGSRYASLWCIQLKQWAQCVGFNLYFTLLIFASARVDLCSWRWAAKQQSELRASLKAGARRKTTGNRV